MGHGRRREHRQQSSRGVDRRGWTARGRRFNDAAPCRTYWNRPWPQHCDYWLAVDDPLVNRAAQRRDRCDGCDVLTDRFTSDAPRTDIVDTRAITYALTPIPKTS